MNFVRAAAGSTMAVLAMVLAALLADPAWRGEAAVTLFLAAVAWALFLGSRRSAAVADRSGWAPAFFDIPAITLADIVIARLHADVAMVVGIQAAASVMVVMASSLWLRRRLVIATAVAAGAGMIALVAYLGLALPFLVVVAVVLAGATVLCLHSTSRLDHLVEQASRHLLEHARARQLLALTIEEQNITSAHTGIVVLDRELRYRVFNQYMEQLSGIHARELIGRTPWDVSPDPAAHGIEADLRRALAGEVVPHTNRVTRPDGRVVWTAGALVPTRGEQGEITGVIAVVQDITERVRIEEELRATRESFQSLMDNLPDAAMVVRDGRVVYANQRLADLVGYDRPADLIGRSAWDLAAPEDQTMVRERAAAVVEGAGTRAVRDVRLVRRDGTRIPAEGTGTAVIYQGERSVLNVLRDVSERKVLQAQLMTADRMASMGLLAAGVAHEVNNPLASVIGNLQLLEEDLRCLAVPSSALEMISSATEAAGRVRDIVRDLKLFSRSDADQETHTLDLRTVVEAALRMAKNDIRHRARVVTDYGAAPPVAAQEWRLVQVFLNLLINAAQAIPAGGVERNEIRVRTSADEAGRAVVDVSDTGHGIPPEILGRIFDPFFTTKQTSDGTGLGLAICDRLVKALGGTIEVESVPDQGSRFRVILPAAPAAPAGAEAAAPRPRPKPPDAPAPRARVLIVDDDSQVGETVRRALAPQHDTLLVNSGRAALAYVRGGEQFDVILCDVMMPEMTGMAFHAELVRVAPQQAERLIFVTGGAFTEDARRYLDHVPNLQVHKPFDLGELRSLVAGCAAR